MTREEALLAIIQFDEKLNIKDCKYLDKERSKNLLVF